MSRKNKILLIGLGALFIIMAVAAWSFLSTSTKRDMMNRTSEKTGSQSATDLLKKRKPVKKRNRVGNQDIAALAKAMDSNKGTKKGTAGKEMAPETKKAAFVSYPESLITLLGIDMDKLLKEREKYLSSVVHVEWMDHIHESLKNLEPEKKEAMVKNHLTLLYIKEQLNDAYLSGKIDAKTFKDGIAELMKWHQKTYQTLLSRDQYMAVFEIPPEKAGEYVDIMTADIPQYSFILNQSMPADEVIKQIEGYKLEEVDSHFKTMIKIRDEIGKKINAGEMTLEQARAAFRESQQAFVSECNEILTSHEIDLIFGSEAGLEAGMVSEKSPRVDMNAEEKLGFPIDNPDTTAEMVNNKLGEDQIEDIKFFHTERKKELDEIGKKLDAGEITIENAKNTANDVESTYKDNCRQVLDDETYRMIFEKPR
ncbi:MAG: hypothetical protein GXP53_11870 [Deltaproteobacteria bacterium]|nr:hypothetical protein [Deltaproteobacteria bacterium]